MQIIENSDLCDISRIQNPKEKQLTFRQHHSPDFIQKHLDYFFKSNSPRIY